MKKKEKKTILYVRIKTSNKNFLTRLKKKLGYGTLSELVDSMVDDAKRVN